MIMWNIQTLFKQHKQLIKLVANLMKPVENMSWCQNEKKNKKLYFAQWNGVYFDT